MTKLIALSLIVLGMLVAQTQPTETASQSRMMQLEAVTVNPIIAATDVNELLVSEAKYTGIYNGMSAAEATLALGYAKISVEQSELAFYRGNIMLEKEFRFLKSLVTKARGSNTKLWDPAIIEEYFKIVGLELQGHEATMEVLRKRLDMDHTFDTIAANVKKEEATTWEKVNRPEFDLWLSRYADINTIVYAADHDPIMREAASHMTTSRAREFHMGMYSTKAAMHSITCYPIKGCSEPIELH